MRVPEPILRRFLGASTVVMSSSATPFGVQRRVLDASSAFSRGLAVESGWEGGVPGERHRAGTARGLLYLHGGAYCIGSPKTHRGIAARLARGLDAEAFVAHYRLAPEHPHPAGFEDVVAAYTAMTDRFAQVVVAGDSAGGGFTLALALHARDSGLRVPAALGLISPWLDLVGPHRDTGDPMITVARLERWKQAYAPHDLRDPSVSPVLADDLSGLPPIIMQSAGDDPLLADAENLDARGVVTEHQRHPGAFHAFPALAGLLAEADVAVDALAASLLAQL